MTEERDEGRQVHENAGIGQERVGEPGPSPRQKAELAPAAGGAGSGSGAADNSTTLTPVAATQTKARETPP